MRKFLFLAVFALVSIVATAQEKCFWVFFTDKNDTQFDPYSYFDAKAIERYQQCGADLYDISNYPLNDSYVNTVGSYSTEVFGESRWLNAIGIEATDDNAALISRLPFVARVQEIVSNGTVANVMTEFKEIEEDNIDILTDQVKRFGGQHFIDKGIDGKGLRICVMDGGFPKVNTHPAFQHLRDNNQILKTYNFPNKKEDVYGWNTHGTMVLSCIAGIKEDGQKLGLATGAEFLLARTEIEPEPFKEEVWWAQGAEWADKNGADIINSSLGYGKDRHWTKDMDGTSYVAKAANKAVEKGILICNSAGNEGDDSRWMTIITPADAENVICVGGIDANLKDYRHISFSSYGPTADKRRKPDVVAFGEAQVANPSGGFTSAFGTSFASPLTAGFCACAWQTKRDLTALQMKAEIQKSCDLYPYYDYAFGYGVPQAAYFTGDLKPAERSFNLVQEKDGVKIDIPKVIEDQDVFINVEGADGVLLGYYKVHPDSTGIKLNNKDFGQGKKLNVSYNGFYDSCPISGMGGDINLLTQYRNSQNGTFKEVKKEGWQKTTYFQYDYILPNGTWNGFNRHFAFGRRWLYGKSYKIGLGLGLDWNRFVAKGQIPDAMEVENRETIMRQMQLRGELMQRIVIRMWGINWDLGVYGGINALRRVKVVDHMKWQDAEGNLTQPYNSKVTSYYNHCRAMNLFEYGATTRVSYSIANLLNIGVYGSYRLSPVITKDDYLIGSKANNPSPWSVGIELEVTP
ncbi:MAG: S8 family serine peptidase [Bacteroidales bacterium]|jgi:subtilisin family serine protease|nr:S8 family serine peptidase [Bacteroidales bacterium]